MWKSPLSQNCLTKDFFAQMEQQPTNYSGFVSGNLVTVALWPKVNYLEICQSISLLQLPPPPCVGFVYYLHF